VDELLEVRGYVIGKGVEPERMKTAVRRAAPNLLVQTVKAGAISNESVVEMIVAQTLRASSSGNLLAKKPEIDLLLRLAGTTQIAEAIRTTGTGTGRSYVLVAAGDREELLAAEGAVLPSAERLPRKPLSKREMLRVEKAALLNAQRT
jgi:tRNA threonylcarbamoyladenosine modification (KEOPS) complex Cgi121 subunit